jgi:ferredoxin-like protein FixX
MTSIVIDGTYRDVRWTVEKGKRDCEHPYVTITDSKGLFNAVEIPNVCPADVHQLIDVEIERRAIAAIKSAARTGRPI